MCRKLNEITAMFQPKENIENIGGVRNKTIAETQEILDCWKSYISELF